MTHPTKESNPKEAIGSTKVPLNLCSPIASAHWALAQYAGMAKYQAWNWRAAGVRASTYIGAIKRHADAYNSASVSTRSTARTTSATSWPARRSCWTPRLPVC